MWSICEWVWNVHLSHIKVAFASNAADKSPPRTLLLRFGWSFEGSLKRHQWRRFRNLPALIRLNNRQGKSPSGLFFFYFHLASYPSVLIWLLHFRALPRVWMRWRGPAYYSKDCRHANSLGRLERGALAVGCLCFGCCARNSFFRLAKASAAWDGGTVRLLTLTNKDTEKRSALSSAPFFILLTSGLSLS